jgi:AcrR family transcriptional regulator
MCATIANMAELKTAGSIRARVRAEMIDEIKDVARRHLATDGANLSLRAVARDMGMVSSALYRYFASRDELLTALIIDAYDAIGTAVEQADEMISDRGDGRARWSACCHAIRTWALGSPNEYALIYGSPVPGYQAPQATTVAAARTPVRLLQIVAESAQAGPRKVTLPGGVAHDLAQLSATGGIPELDSSLLAVASIAWIHVFGAVSFELFGQLNNVIFDRDGYFDLQVGLMADLIGL